jgi:hypothetical protein
MTRWFAFEFVIRYICCSVARHPDLECESLVRPVSGFPLIVYDEIDNKPVYHDVMAIDAASQTLTVNLTVWVRQDVLG